MTIVNGPALLKAAPMSPMVETKQVEHGVSHGLSFAGYDIRVKQTVRFVPPDPARAFEILHRDHHGLSRSDGCYLESFHGYVEVDGERTLGRFALASSVERFQVPADLVGIVHDKSTWARQALSVLNTVIEPGWMGDALTLELVFHGNGELHIPAGAGIAQVLFHRIETPAQYSGKYQWQSAEPVAAIMDGAYQDQVLA